MPDISSLEQAEFDRVLGKFASEYKSDPHDRGRSWDHANSAWKRYVSGQITADDAALHLAFYLASWGMYRGSSDLLQRDYKVLLPAVRWLHTEASKDWQDCMFKARPVDILVKDLKELADGLKSHLQPKLAWPKKKKLPANVSDTLLSKILLVTLECVPAFDAQVKKALHEVLGAQYLIGDGFSVARLEATIELARANQPLIENGRKRVEQECLVSYPLTKVLDVYLWYRGRKVSPE